MISPTFLNPDRLINFLGIHHFFYLSYCLSPDTTGGMDNIELFSKNGVCIGAPSINLSETLK